MAQDVKIDLNQLQIPPTSAATGVPLNHRLRTSLAQNPHTDELVAQARANNAARQAVVAKHEQEQQEMASIRAQIAQIEQKQHEKSHPSTTSEPDTASVSTRHHKWSLFHR